MKSRFSCISCTGSETEAETEIRKQTTQNRYKTDRQKNDRQQTVALKPEGRDVSKEV
jgi:hypothetical protein